MNIVVKSRIESAKYVCKVLGRVNGAVSAESIIHDFDPDNDEVYDNARQAIARRTLSEFDGTFKLMRDAGYTFDQAWNTAERATWGIKARASREKFIEAQNENRAKS